MKKITSCVLAIVMVLCLSFILCGCSTQVNTYNKLYSFIKSKSSARLYTMNGTDGVKATTTHSQTNTQVEGVGEADIVVTDGNYIYAIIDNVLKIVAVDGSDVTVVGEIDRQVVDTKKEDIQQLYVDGDKLVLILKAYNYDYHINGGILGSWVGFSDPYGIVEVYDISDKAHPNLTHTYQQKGYYCDSRMIEGQIYFITSYYITGNIEKSDFSTYVPDMSCDGNNSFVAIEDILIRPQMEVANYTVVGSFDTITGTSNGSKALLGYVDNIYMSTNNLYLACPVYNEKAYTVDTDIICIALDRNLNATKQVRINGGVLNQFSMDEYNGYLRVVTTSEQYSDQIIDDAELTTSNNLYVINSEMKVVSSLTNIAPNERIYSARFLQEVVYFVTFRQVDPLFCVDLSDVTNPTITSELKVPGFSEYLHPYGEGLLFGLGRNANEEGRTDYLKISMFDISNKNALSEKHTLVIDGKKNSEANYNHKAILIDVDKNIIGFSTETSYMVYSYDAQDGFVLLAEVTPELEQGYWTTLRGMYINDNCYILANDTILVYDMADWTQLGKIIIE